VQGLCKSISFFTNKHHYEVFLECLIIIHPVEIGLFIVSLESKDFDTVLSKEIH